MGFRNGAWATVWGVEETPSGKATRVRLSVGKRNGNTGKYVTDFSGFCTFIGDAHNAASQSLKEKDRIKLESCDVSTIYDKEKDKNYTTYKVFSYSLDDDKENTHRNNDNNNKMSAGETLEDVVEDDDEEMPF